MFNCGLKTAQLAFVSQKTAVSVSGHCKALDLIFTEGFTLSINYFLLLDSLKFSLFNRCQSCTNIPRPVLAWLLFRFCHLGTNFIIFSTWQELFTWQCTVRTNCPPLVILTLLCRMFGARQSKPKLRSGNLWKRLVYRYRSIKEFYDFKHSTSSISVQTKHGYLKKTAWHNCGIQQYQYYNLLKSFTYVRGCGEECKCTESQIIEVVVCKKGPNHPL